MAFIELVRLSAAAIRQFSTFKRASTGPAGCCSSRNKTGEQGCTHMYPYASALECTIEYTNAEPPCTGVYWYIPRYADFGIYRYVRVCTFPKKYIRVCTSMYFSAKVYTNLYYSIVTCHRTSRYIPVYTGTYRLTPGVGDSRCILEFQPRQKVCRPGISRPARDVSPDREVPAGPGASLPGSRPGLPPRGQCHLE
jgi:hypothetical protein